MELRSTPEDNDPRFRKVGEKQVGSQKAGRFWTSVHQRIAPLTDAEKASFDEWMRLLRKPGYSYTTSCGKNG